MKFSKLIFLFVLCFSLTSCYEKLDFDQLDNYVYEPIFTSSLTSFTLVPGQFFNSQGVQENSIVDETRFEIFEANIVKDNVVQLDFYAEIKNEFDRDVTINIDFLDDNDREVLNNKITNIMKKMQVGGGKMTLGENIKLLKQMIKEQCKIEKNLLKNIKKQQKCIKQNKVDFLPS